MLFEEYDNVEVFDSKLAAAGIRFLVEEAKRYERETLPDGYKNEVKVYDDLCSSIACHWGPNAFGFIYVKGMN